MTSDGLVSIMASMQQPLLTSDEVAKMLKVSRSYAYLMMKRGDLPIVHVGTVIRVRPKDLERYINDNATKSLMVDGEAQPYRVATALSCSNVSDIGDPFLIGRTSLKLLVEQVMIRMVIAVGAPQKGSSISQRI